MCRPYIFILAVQIIAVCSLEEPSGADQSRSKTQDEKAESKTDLVFGNSYLKLAEKHFFVDKTLMIEEFINWNETAIYIAAPPRSGKSTNLQMIHTFLGVKINPGTCDIVPKDMSDSFKIFKNLEIGKVKNGQFLSTHLGTYPVLHLNFNSLKYSRYYENFLSDFELLMQSAYLKYEYLPRCRVWKEQNQERFSNYSHGIFKDSEDLLNSGVFLTELLHFQFKKECIVLIDGYDSLILESIFESEPKHPDFKRSLKFLISFLGLVVTDNLYVGKTLVTGITRLATVLSPYGDTFKTHSFYTEPWAKYYGFSEEEVEKLRKIIYPGSSLDYIKRRFEGYSMPMKPGRKTFNVYSIKQYLFYPHKENTWAQSNKYVLLRFLPLFRPDILGQELLSLIRGDGVPVLLKETLGMDDIKSLADLRAGYWSHRGTGVSLYSKEIFLQFLTDFGFLTVTSLPSTHKMLVLIPNMEIEELLEGISYEVMKDGFWPKEGLWSEDDNINRVFFKVSKSLKELNENKTNHVRFLFNFETLLNNSKVPIYYEKYFVVQLMRGLIQDSEIGSIPLLRREIVLDPQNRIDLAFVAGNNRKAFVFEFKLNEGSSSEALKEVQGKNYTGFFQSVPNSFVKENGTIILIGIHCDQPWREVKAHVICSESYYCVEGDRKDIDLSKVIEVNRKDIEGYRNETIQAEER